MPRIIECVPNFSDGKNKDVIRKLTEAACSVAGAALLDYSADENHNRSVFTVLGQPDAVVEAAFRLAAVAVNEIDLNKQKGEHPRMGAVDVIPIVPIRNVKMDECVSLSESLAKRIWDELSLPSFLYEQSAKDNKRKNLADLRRGGFEAMAQKVLLPEWKPDYGERKIHKTAGITAIGAREPLIAFNINLSTDNIETADKIAKAVRGSSGGFKYCKAIGVTLFDRGIVQVSMNMVNYRKTPIHIVFETVKREAKRYGVSIVGSEIIGLVPEKALMDAAEYYLQIENFNYEERILENRIYDAGL